LNHRSSLPFKKKGAKLPFAVHLGKRKTGFDEMPQSDGNWPKTTICVFCGNPGFLVKKA